MKKKLVPISVLPAPTEYVLAIQNELKGWAFDETQVPEFRGRWRELAFQSHNTRIPAPAQGSQLDLEIGTGNGFYFAHRAQLHPGRLLVGLEIKFKPLVQAIRRALRQGSQNMRIARYNASHIDEIFSENEIDDVIIHHPDPWPKLKQHKHRLLQKEWIVKLSEIQKPGSTIDFQTDDHNYFEWAMENFSDSPYEIVDRQVGVKEGAVQTHFEKIFRAKAVPIARATLLNSKI